MSLTKPVTSVTRSTCLTACFQRMKLSETSMKQPLRAYSSQNNREKIRRQDARADETKSMERNFTRNWQVGDVYAPHDLSAAEARKWRKRYSPTTDAFDALSLNPLDMYKNFSVMSEYVTEMGRIRPRTSTGLRRVNQRKISKAIRRAIALGLMPSVHRHPEIIRHEMAQRKLGAGGRFL